MTARHAPEAAHHLKLQISTLREVTETEPLVGTCGACVPDQDIRSGARATPIHPEG